MYMKRLVMNIATKPTAFLLMVHGRENQGSSGLPAGAYAEQWQ
jgi:hypothetical protein